ncbi:hypothetical protein M3Y98_00767900 [Aphelenchoides besseyi]|nr:hypothetical protein M3Y98_00767900 [Aphelenchoides besseyi]KAI6211707.1 hypothetical protein M3Y96_00462700 [Aphelenchoides besseyi]
MYGGSDAQTSDSLFLASLLSQATANGTPSGFVPVTVPPVQLLNSAITAEIQRLSHAATSVRLTEEPPTAQLPALSLPSIRQPVDKPLDLSVKKYPNCSEATTSRASVIKTYQPRSSPVGVKRSTSSLCYRATPDPDVSDHFRRSLSGKWPRRPASYSHYSETPKSCVVINEGQVEDHFRRTFERLQKKEEEKANSTRL